MKECLRKLIKFILKILIIIVYRPKVLGKENLPKDSAAIICPNHVHALDSAVIVMMNKRKINILAKQEIFKNKFIIFLADIFGVYPVKRNGKSIESVKTSLRILKNKELLMIFPEGTRNGMAKKIKPRDGAIKLALQAGVPIIPVGVQGNFKFFRKVKINIGKPINYQNKEIDITNKDIMEKLTTKLMDRIVDLRDEKI